MKLGLSYSPPYFLCFFIFSLNDLSSSTSLLPLHLPLSHLSSPYYLFLLLSISSIFLIVIVFLPFLFFPSILPFSSSLLYSLHSPLHLPLTSHLLTILLFVSPSLLSSLSSLSSSSSTFLQLYPSLPFSVLSPISPSILVSSLHTLLSPSRLSHPHLALHLPHHGLSIQLSSPKLPPSFLFPSRRPSLPPSHLLSFLPFIPAYHRPFPSTSSFFPFSMILRL